MKILRIPVRYTVVFGLLITTMFDSFSQSFDIEAVSKAKPLTVSGGLNANGVFNAGLPNSSSPFDVYLAGNLNFSILGVINMPLMLNYSSRKISFSQGYNFNQFSVAPTYKWATAYAGTNYMTFSPYSLNGHQYVGGGVELKPKNWHIKAMAGRLIKGQFEDTLVAGPTYRRMGYGYQVQYNPGTYTLGLTMFKASDDVGSLPVDKRFFKDNVINAKDNMVVGLTLGTTLFHALQLNVEYTNSVLTKDQSTNYSPVKLRSLAGIFMKGNATSESYNAFKSSLNYHIAKTNTIIGVGYERIDPNYTTLGGYYFVNDMENYTFNFVQPLLDNKLNVSTNVGFQKDDIKRTKASQQSRIIGSLTANWNIKDDFSMGLNFSNFQSYKFLNDTYSRLTRVPGVPIDTLNFALISQTYGYNLNKTLTKTEEKQNSINLNATYLVSKNKVDNQLDPSSKTNIFNANANYAVAFLQKQMSINLGMSYFRNSLLEGLVQGVGPTLGIQKNFLKQLSTNLNLGAFSTSSQLVDPAQSSSTLALNASCVANYSVGKGHNFSFNTSFVKSFANNFLNGNIGYSYSF